MFSRAAQLGIVALCLLFCGCARRNPNANTFVFLIESSPANLDPRIGTDAVSERIDALLFDGLVSRGSNFQLQPSLAERWENPNPLLWIFHLRSGVRFHDGRALTSRDVRWTLETMRDHTIISPKTGAYAKISQIETPDTVTVLLHLSAPDPALLWNLSDGAFGVIPSGSGKDFAQHPIGTGPFQFVRQVTDKDVVIERAPQSWHTPPHLQTVRFAVVPDAITRALELRKGSADIALSSLTPDMVSALAHDPHLQVISAPGSIVAYLAFNLRDPLLQDVRVRQAIADAINRPLIVRTLLGGYARPATSLLPPSHWAFDHDLQTQTFDPVQANQILDQAGYKRGANGVRFSLTMKTSTDEGTRLFAAVLQQQLQAVGIDLRLRSYEFATFYADVVRGAFQMYSLRWIGGNEDPDIFHYAMASDEVPPKGANRGHYKNVKLDELLDHAASASTQSERVADYIQVQQILARDLPAINLWYLDNVAVVSRRVHGLQLSPSGDYKFLETVTLN
jgi:peptide/nickel transport system substrate-binding protein